MYYKGKKIERGQGGTHPDNFGYGPEIRSELAKKIPLNTEKVLDVGTGFASNLLFLRNTLPESTAIWSIDPAEEVLRDAEALLKEKELKRIKLVEAYAESMPFEDGFFDLITSVMVLHHLEDVQPALREMQRVLKNGKHLLIADWKPEAKVLPFSGHHQGSDFVTSSRVLEVLRGIGVDAVVVERPLWYLIDGRK